MTLNFDLNGMAISAFKGTLLMLVLTRKLMEKLFIGDDICVTIVRIEGGQVRLGIDAPRDVSVVRSELDPLRQAPPPRSVPRTNPGPDASPFKHSPYEARGNDSRRRGRSR